MKKILKTLKQNYLYGIMIILVLISVIVAIIAYKKHCKYETATQNQYNLALYELVDYIQNVENYLAKSVISSTPEHGAETLTHVWREANLAQVYLSQLPTNNDELSNTAKFLNQVSEYSYTLSRKNIYNEKLTQEELDNLEKLHDYSMELKSILNQISLDMSEGNINWNDLTSKTETAFAQQVSNMSKESFSNIDENFGEYAGLIYDGAYSEHLENAEKKGITGEEILEEDAKNVAISFIGKDRIMYIKSNGLIKNGNIEVYDFSVGINGGDKNNPLNISISKKGGHIVLMNYNREVQTEVLLQEEANLIGKDFLNNKGFENMKETYYLKQGGIVTINYAYINNNVTIYPDLIKLKVALDNGEILGIETSGYLNNHTEREIVNPRISLETAKQNLNKNLQISSSGLAIIPTEWKKEIFCYEFKGKLDETDFLVYINAENGKEENILVIINTPNGTLTQ